MYSFSYLLKVFYCVLLVYKAHCWVNAGCEVELEEVTLLSRSVVITHSLQYSGLCTSQVRWHVVGLRLVLPVLWVEHMTSLLMSRGRKLYVLLPGWSISVLPSKCEMVAAPLAWPLSDCHGKSPSADGQGAWVRQTPFLLKTFETGDHLMLQHSLAYFGWFTYPYKTGPRYVHRWLSYKEESCKGDRATLLF